MLKIKFIPCFFVIIIILSCGSSKSFREQYIEKIQNKRDHRKVPSWVLRKPTLGEYYVGVGMVSKVKFPYNYTQKSKENALADLTSEISVNVSNESVLNSLDYGNGVSEDFSSLVKSSSKAELQGFELEDTYESDIEYWVYYKLNKAKYKGIQQAKRDKILSKAKDLLKIAEDYRSKYDYHNALVNYIKTLEKIKNYWTESLEMTWKRNKIFLGNYIIKSITDIFKDIQIKPKYTNFIATRGREISKDKLNIFVKTSRGNLLNLPIIYRYSSKRWDKRTTTSIEGNLNLSVRKISSKNTKELIDVSLDMGYILKESTKDVSVQKIIERMNLPKAIITVSIENPRILLECKDAQIEKKLVEVLNKNKIEISNGGEYDFKIKSIIGIENYEKGNGLFYKSNIKVIFKIYDSSNQLVATQEALEQGKSAKNKLDALKDAYRQITEYIQYRLRGKISALLF